VKQVTVPIEEWRRLVDSGVSAPARVIPRGNSMWPLIRGGKDVIEVKPWTCGQSGEYKLRVGDIVVFQRADGAYIVHRIWKIKKVASANETSPQIMIQTFGDNCQQPDEPVPQESVCGIVTKIYRDGKTVDPYTKSATAIATANRNLAPIRRGLAGMKHMIRRKTS